MENKQQKIIKSHLDIENQQFGKLTALKRTKTNSKGDYWLCKCSCGNYKEIRIDSLLNGRTISCGCFAKEVQRKRKTKHGMIKSRLYSIYYGMHQRCENPNAHYFEYYGGRGISICSEWCGENGFNNFYEWAMKNGYSDNLTIDRIDGNFGYSPLNCRWITKMEQQQNLRTTVKIHVDGEELTLKEASQKYGINARNIYLRIKSGWSDEDAVKTPINAKYANKRFKCESV